MSGSADQAGSGPHGFNNARSNILSSAESQRYSPYRSEIQVPQQQINSQLKSQSQPQPSAITSFDKQALGQQGDIRSTQQNINIKSQLITTSTGGNKKNLSTIGSLFDSLGNLQDNENKEFSCCFVVLLFLLVLFFFCFILPSINTNNPPNLQINFRRVRTQYIKNDK